VIEKEIQALSNASPAAGGLCLIAILQGGSAQVCHKEAQKAQKGGVFIFSAYPCVPLRLCGKQVVRAHLPQSFTACLRQADNEMKL